VGRRRAFTREFKLEAVRLIRDRGITVAQASRDLGVHKNVLRKWVRDFEADPQQAFPGQGQMKPEQLEVEAIRSAIAGLPSYGYHRVLAGLTREREENGLAPFNHKRVYRVMKARGLLLQRHSGLGPERRHDGRVATAEPKTRWCSDGFEAACEDGARVRITWISAHESD
jgi:transposase-like protein